MFMKKLTDLRSELYLRIKQFAVPFFVIVYVGFLVFLYLANVSIDEGTASMYRTLDAIFYVFCVLLPFAVAGTVFLIVVHCMRKKEYNRIFNKKKTPVRPFDVLVIIEAALFLAVCIVGFFLFFSLLQKPVAEEEYVSYVTGALKTVFYLCCALLPVTAASTALLYVFKKKTERAYEENVRKKVFPFDVLLAVAAGILSAISLAEFILSLLFAAEAVTGYANVVAAVKTFFAFFCILFPVSIVGTVFLYYYKEKKDSAASAVKNGRRVLPFDVILAIGMGLFCALCLYPIIYVIAGSFNQGADYAVGGVYFLPRLFTFENYRVVLTNVKLWHSYLVTIGRTVIGTATSLIFTSIVAYAMSRPNLKFKRVFYWINIFTMFFGGGLVPYFLIIKSVGLYNTFWVYIIPGLFSVYNMIVLQSGFKAIDSEIHDAAVVDGAGEFRIWWQIYMPLSKPVLATIVLWLAVGHWNSYFDTMIYTNSDNLQSLQYFLLKAIQTASMTEGMPPEMMERLSSKTVSLAAIIISIVPVLFFFPLVRKNFASGIMVGSLKG